MSQEEQKRFLLEVFSSLFMQVTMSALLQHFCATLQGSFVPEREMLPPSVFSFNSY